MKPKPLEKQVEVEIANENGKAVIQGKTNVPFKVFVGLVLKRKVQLLFKEWQDEPVIIGSELLTHLASAPDDSQEDRGNLVLVTLGVGIFAGIVLSLLVLLAFSLFGAQPGMQTLLVLLAAFLCVALLVRTLQRTHMRSAAKQRLSEEMERITELLAK